MSQQPGQGAGPQYSLDGRWWWDGYRWMPVLRRPQPFRMTLWRWLWLAWCCLWGVVWAFLFWPAAAFSFAMIALIAVRTKGDDAPETGGW